MVVVVGHGIGGWNWWVGYMIYDIRLSNAFLWDETARLNYLRIKVN